jgi:hypothetical protein
MLLLVWNIGEHCFVTTTDTNVISKKDFDVVSMLHGIMSFNDWMTDNHVTSNKFLMIGVCYTG